MELDGNTITGTVEVAEGVTLQVSDAATADYDVTDGNYGMIKVTGAGTVKGAAATENSDVYLQVEEEDGYVSFHAAKLNIDQMMLRPEQQGLYFNHQFGGDEKVKAQVASYGIALSLAGAHYYLSGNVTREKNLFSYYGPACVFLNGYTLASSNTSTVFTGTSTNSSVITIMGTGNVTNTGGGYAINVNSGAVNIYGGVYSTNGKRVISSLKSTDVVNIYGGEIADATEYAIFATDGATINMYGGKITKKGVWLNPSTSKATFVFNGGTIETSLGGSDGSIYLNGGTIGKDAVVYAGGSEADGTSMELYLGNTTFAEGATINNMTAVSNVIVTKDFTGTATVNLNAEGTQWGDDYFGIRTVGITAPEGYTGRLYGKVINDPIAYGLLPSKTDDSVVVGKTSVIDGGIETWYHDNADAVAAYTGGTLKLHVVEPLVMDKDITVDLNGLQNLSITGTGVLTGLDSSTRENYTGTPAYAVVSVDGIQSIAPETAKDGTVKGYLNITDDNGVTTFTYYEMKLSGVALKANTQKVGMYYKGIWSFHQMLPGGFVDAGIMVSVKERPAAGFAETTGNGWHSWNAAVITNGKPLTGVLVDGIMKAGNSPTDNKNNSETKIHAAAFISVDNGDGTITDILTDVKSLSIFDVLKHIEENTTAYEENETKLANFYTAWKDLALLDVWNFTKIGKTA